MFGFLFKKIFGSKNERYLRRLRPLVQRINALEPQMQELADEDFPPRILQYKNAVQQEGQSLDALPSLPLLDGSAKIANLSAPVTVERDAQGVPTIRGSQRLDVARALGFLHAQDRFFQMDCTRRHAAGELAELFGSAAVPRE